MPERSFLLLAGKKDKAAECRRWNPSPSNNGVTGKTRIQPGFSMYVTGWLRMPYRFATGKSVHVVRSRVRLYLLQHVLEVFTTGQRNRVRFGRPRKQSRFLGEGDAETDLFQRLQRMFQRSSSLARCICAPIGLQVSRCGYG